MESTLKEEFKASLPDMIGILANHLSEKGLPKDLINRISQVSFKTDGQGSLSGRLTEQSSA